MRRTLVLLLCILPFSGCSTAAPNALSDAQGAQLVGQYQAALGESMDSLGARLLIGSSGSSTSNVLVSPAGILETLALLYPGVVGETKVQIAKVLGMALSPTQYATLVNQDLQLLTDNLRSGGNEFILANSLWVDSGFPIQSQYEDVVKNGLHASINPADFASDPKNATAKINSWVYGETHHFITEAVPSGVIDTLTKVVQVNAMYLNSSWKYPFGANSVWSEGFTTLGGTKQVDEMHGHYSSLSYLQSSNFQAVALPYKGTSLEFLVILPNVGQFQNVGHEIQNGFMPVAKELKPRMDMTVSIPVFNVADALDLKQSLESLGMRLAFQPGKADLSGIGGAPGQLYVKDALQQCHLYVTEQGTVGAASTEIVDEVLSQPLLPDNFLINRPFYFSILDPKTGVTLFDGQIVDPNP